jgi:hypothetical protein
MKKYMKNILFVMAAVVFFSLRSSAQFEKGNYIIGGSFQANFVSPTDSDVQDHHISFDPRFGYYFLNGFAAGMDGTVAFDKTGENTSSVVGAGPFVRYHILKYFYAEIAYQYLIDNTKRANSTKSDFVYTTTNENKYEGGFGYIFMLNKHVAIEPRLLYDVYAANGATISAGPVFSIGIHNYFWKF